MRSPGWRVRRTRRGDFQIRLPSVERDVLRALPDQLRRLLDAEDASLLRLFPPAYQDDPEANAEYERLVHDDLRLRRLQALEVLEGTIDAERLDEDQMQAWLTALNDLRLVLGTKLDVSEELDPEAMPDDDPEAHGHALYYYLGWLQEQVVEALVSSLRRE